MKCHNKSVISLMASFHVALCACMLSRFGSVQFFATPWTVSHPAPLSMRFSRQEYWSGLSCPPPGDLPHPRMEPTFSHVYWIDKQIVYHTWEAFHVALSHQ